MKRYPVAGELLEHRLFFGLTMQDLVVGIFPVAGLAVGESVDSALHPPLGAFLPLIFGAVGIVVALFVLLRTPAGQTPAEWLQAAAYFYAGPTRFLWQPVERNQSDGKILDDIRTLHDTSTPGTQSSRSRHPDTATADASADGTPTSDDGPSDGSPLHTDGGTLNANTDANADRDVN